MRILFFSCLIFIVIAGCKKNKTSRVDIYMLKSFTYSINQSTMPVTHVITNAVLADTLLVADKDIDFYTKSTTTFKLRKDIRPVIQNFGPDKAFAVTVNGQPVYYGKFHPAYMSSIVLGLATIDPFYYNNNNLEIRYITMSGSYDLAQFDKRNDDQLIEALRASGKLR